MDQLRLLPCSCEIIHKCPRRRQSLRRVSLARSRQYASSVRQFLHAGHFPSPHARVFISGAGVCEMKYNTQARRGSMPKVERAGCKPCARSHTRLNEAGLDSMGREKQTNKFRFAVSRGSGKKLTYEFVNRAFTQLRCIH